MSGMNRRKFAEAIALTALVPILGASAGPVRWALPVATGSPTTTHAVNEPGALAKALAEAIRVQYGDRLSEADLDVVTRQIEAGLERAEKIRQVVLGNGDEPDFVFSAIRPENAG